MVKTFCSICSSKNHRGGGNIKYFCLRGGEKHPGGEALPGGTWGVEDTMTMPNVTI